MACTFIARRVMTFICIAYTVIAYVVMACALMPYTVRAYSVRAYIVTVAVVMADRVVAVCTRVRACQPACMHVLACVRAYARALLHAHKLPQGRRHN